MIKRTGLTRIDLVVAVACVVFVLANVPVIVAGGRGRAKLEVCMANLRALTAAWSMYADDHQGRIPCGDIQYCRSSTWTTSYDALVRASAGPGWYDWPHDWPPCDFENDPTTVTQPYPKEYWEHSIADGSLWMYLRDYRVYKCPAGKKNQYVTYTVADSMNTYPYWPTSNMEVAKTVELKNRNQIIRPAERIVFIDEGSAGKGAFAIDYARPRFYDAPPKHHSNGSTFSFADGHAEYRKWVDQRTIEYPGWVNPPPDQPCNQDLYWLQKGVWGSLGYEPSCPPE